jgi:cytidylate kinase
MKETPRVAVTISRQTGSGGAYLGYLVAREMGFKYIDREILYRAARELGTDVGNLERIDEKSSGFIENILKGFSFGVPESTFVHPTKVPVYDRDLFAAECRIMNEIAEQHDAVFVGRAGFHALRNKPDVLRVFTHAPAAFRIERVMKMRKVDRREAQAIVTDSDQRRAKFVRDMVGVHWMNTGNYHLCIDSGAIDFTDSLDIIVRLVRKKWPRK